MLLRLAVVLIALAGTILAGPAAADWRDEVKALRVGVLAPADSAYRVRVLEPFRLYLEERLALPVEIVPVPSYTELIDAQSGAHVQYALHSATSFASAVEACQCIEAIGAPLSAGGALGFYSVLVAKADSGIASLEDARGRRLALAGEESIAGHLVPMHGFSKESVDPGTFFSRIDIAADPEAAIRSLLAGEVDVAVAWSSLTGVESAGYDFGSLTRMVGDGSLSMADIRVVWQSRLIPFGPHAVRSDVPDELKSLLSEALRSMATEAPQALDAVDRAGFGGGGFATPDPTLYAMMRELVHTPVAAATE